MNIKLKHTPHTHHQGRDLFALDVESLLESEFPESETDDGTLSPRCISC